MMRTMGGPTVLMLGGTGRTGRRVLGELLARGCTVRAIVRSRGALPPAVVGHPALTLLEGSLLSLGDSDWHCMVQGCDAVVSCLGHLVSVRGILGPPYRLVVRALQRATRAIEANQPGRPVRVILMSSVSVHDAPGVRTRRRAHERLFLAMLGLFLPPVRDNQRAADFLRVVIGGAHPLIEWAMVRPDTLEEGPAGAYILHEQLANSVFAPGHTRMANVADFMAELVTDDATWARWKGRMPVVLDAASSAEATPHPLDAAGEPPALAVRARPGAAAQG
ncbi:MAG: NAD(P)H-binding protein [Gemmatimonadetes bacterium]|nr:NAD(P)H-binding protein [Gemmatimonadota bacterium]